MQSEFGSHRRLRPSAAIFRVRIVRLPRTLLVALVFCCSLPGVCRPQFVSYSAVLAPNGTALCTSSPSVSTVNSSLTSCSVNCLTTSGGTCRGFTFDSATFSCGLFNYDIGEFSVSGTCVLYTLSDRPFPGYDWQYPTVNATDCSLPFTYNRMLFYRCVHTVVGSGASCNRFACRSPQPPSDLVNCINVPGFDVINTSLVVSYEMQPLNQTTSVVLPAVNDWLIVQQRVNDTVNFNRTITEYIQGFGSYSVNESFWAGLDLLNSLTTEQGYTRVRFEFYSNVSQPSQQGWYSAEYSAFSVGSPSSGYPINIYGYSGDAGDALANPPHPNYMCGLNGATFAAYDSMSPTNTTASSYGGGWWYPTMPATFQMANLNGKYHIVSAGSGQAFTAMFWNVTSYASPPSVAPGQLSMSRIMVKRP